MPTPLSPTCLVASMGLVRGGWERGEREEFSRSDGEEDSERWGGGGSNDDGGDVPLAGGVLWMIERCAMAFDLLLASVAAPPAARPTDAARSTDIAPPTELEVDEHDPSTTPSSPAPGSCNGRAVAWSYEGRSPMRRLSSSRSPTGGGRSSPIATAGRRAAGRAARPRGGDQA
eukprot:CAMPEP_0181239884 /NCGR_PEP_ID=MMETSP1096-20121128/40204_1 /TAXON_ID=156174 ORGANISM="Chrysochromulina ericina, Strain CCMP281" /NCGR_SAMPLE_ID=MMETSP1096 /ASSEMBLY_ACC=CAM_ASM_000453 /LENGTH=172 /DNA_ID=CAMNT_0023335675 /DNA_START=123 /DNA_END=638 /DNA_ORIENTATION=-